MSKTKKTLLALILCFITIFSIPIQTLYASSSLSFILLSKYSAVVDIGNQFYIFALTSNAKDPTWKSSDSSIASVNTYGLVTAKKSGTVTITAKIKNAEAACKVTVNKTKVTLSKTSASIERNQTIKLSATTSNNSKVTWKSNKKSIATVDENGKVIGIKPGEATITATADGSSSTCKIKVKSPTISLNSTSIKLYRCQKSKLSATVSSGISPVWRTNKKSVATVDALGNVTAIKHGTATITATVDGVSKSCTVVVEKPTITLSSSEITLKEGTSAKITAKVSSGLSPVWSTSNSNVVKVDSTGTITAIKKGTAYIYASEDGTKVKCTVHITK
ncbi:Ig domain-containing protein [Ruminiclostridium herbifermentans]|uniref:Ig domain-containing protein n=1 Tax=Ruminiclostridium herbifermentans TaxID=2488810 RepID=A0A4U7JG11_9FIRM|nr:Ig-like domain-containing protein [Ruminiclostridium herbifermentans]QNU67715.1 Ig domain-containing protein [Ruminiclostridium herbifermentans]